ncbi:hypothetical protein AAVH_14382, partial [Aphelenchoides avenae]
TFTPFICFLVPVVACCVAVIFILPLNHTFVYIGIFSIATFPIVNATLTILFVSPYRSFTASLSRISRYKATAPVEQLFSSVWAHKVPR